MWFTTDWMKDSEDIEGELFEGGEVCDECGQPVEEYYLFNGEPVCLDCFVQDGWRPKQPR